MIRHLPSSLLAAIAFLTRVPVGDAEISPADQQHAARWFPVVGALLACVEGAFALALGRLTFDDLSVAVLVAALGVVATGALHEDGLADTADAIGASRGDRERFFVVLKDSRIGAFGACAIGLSLLSVVSLYTDLGPALPAALIVCETLSRAVPAWLMSVEPYVKPLTTRRSGDLTRCSKSDGSVAIAAALCLSAGACFLSDQLSIAQLLGAIAAAAVVGVSMRIYFRRKIGGVTGDVLGASQQISRIAILVGIVAARTGLSG